MDEKLQWYLPESDEPISTEELISQLKKGGLRFDSYVWGPHLSVAKWHRIFELEIFQKAMSPYPVVSVPRQHSKGRLAEWQLVHLNLETEGEYGIENLYRRFPRAPMEAEAIVHNQKSHCIAQCFDISEKGVFLRIDDVELFKKGEEVILTIRNAPMMGTFSIHCIVLRILRKGELKGYGLYFLKLNPQIRQKIAQYVFKKLSAAPLKEHQAA